MPNVFLPLGADSNQQTLISQLNNNFAQLDAETVTKVFKGPNGTTATMGQLARNTQELGVQVQDSSGNTASLGVLASGLMGYEIDISGGGKIVMGAYKSNRFGLVFYDSTGMARILQGQAPDDGRMGLWISKAGQDVILLLGG